MPAAQPILPYGRQAIDDDDVAAVASVLRSDWLTTGPTVRAFETALAERAGAAHAVACSSGTAALNLACLALGLGPGHAVIVPTMTFAATAEVVRYLGARPLLADCRPADFNLDVADAERPIRSALEEGLQRALMRKVRVIRRRGRTPGRIEMEYYDNNDLTALTATLLGRARTASAPAP